MTATRVAGFGAVVTRAGLLLILMLWAGACGGDTPILVTLVGKYQDAAFIELTPTLSGSDRTSAKQLLDTAQRQHVFYLTAGLAGMLHIDALAVNGQLEGCTMGHTRTDVFVEPEFTHAIPVFIDLAQMLPATCPLVVMHSEVQVTADTPKLNCGDSCQVDLLAGTTVTLTAAIANPSTTRAWTGDCSGPERLCEVKMSGARSVAVHDLSPFRPQMIPVPSGSFMMGSSPSEVGRGNDEVQHQVIINTAFVMAETEITQSQYWQLMGVNPSNFQTDPELPVENVSWLDAVAFCNRLSEKEALPPCYVISGEDVSWPKGVNCRGYRLPTEAEWEYAARSGTSTPYAGSDKVDEVAWYRGNSGLTTHKVGTKKPNQWGFYDLSGNVWEWVWDWACSYSQPFPNVDPVGCALEDGRIIRGGSLSDKIELARVAYRTGFPPGNVTRYLGFRVVRSYP